MVDFLKKKSFWLVILLFLLFFIPIVFPALTQNLFDNDLSSEDLTFLDIGNLTRYLVISKFANVTSSSLNLSGNGAVLYDYWNFTPTYADGLDYNNSNFWTTLDGASPFIVKSLANGSEVYAQSIPGKGCAGADNPIDISKYGDSLYLLGQRDDLVARFKESDGTYDSFCFNLTDLADPDDFSTYGIAYNGTNFWILENLVSQNDRIHKYNSTGGFISYCNLTETSTPSGLYFNGTYFYLNDGEIVRRYYENCTYTDWFFNLTVNPSDVRGITYNGTHFWVSYPGEAPPVVYRYNSSNYPSNPNLEVGTPDGTVEWNFDGVFNQSQNKTLDISTVINSALNSGDCDCNNCSLVNNDLNCSIPFLFHSGTGGVLSYSDISITYNHRPRIYTNVSLPSSVDQNENVVLQVNVSDSDDDIISFCNFTAVSPSDIHVIDNENGTYQNVSGNFIFNSSEVQANETGLYIWNVTCGDTTGLTSVATGLFSANDTQFPSAIIYSPENTTYTVSSIDFNKLVSDDVGVSSCWYSLDGGSSNTTLDCVQNTTLSLVNGDYTLILWVEDYADKQNSTNVTFSVDVPSSSATATGGGGATKVIVIAANLSWTLSNDRQGSSYVYELLQNDKRKDDLVFDNLGEEVIKVEISCEDVPVTTGVEFPNRIGLCDFIELANASSVLPVSKTGVVTTFFLLDIPDDFEDGVYESNIVATDKRGGRNSITISARVGDLGVFGFFFNKLLKTSVVDLRELNEKAVPFNVPNLLIVGFLGLAVFLLLNNLVFKVFIRGVASDVLISFGVSVGISFVILLLL